MQKRVFSQLWMLFVMAAFAAITLSGCSGDNGANGTSSGTVTGLVTDTNSNKLAGITVTPSPAVTGVTNVTTDANGVYAITIPNGNFTLTFAKAGYTSQSKSVSVVSGQTTTLNVPNMVQTAAAIVNVANASFNASGTATLSAAAITNDPALQGQPATFEWKDAAGNVIGTGPSITVTRPSTAAFKAVVAEEIAPLKKIQPPVVVVDATGEKNTYKATRVFETLDRVMVVGIPQEAFEVAALTPYKVTATIGGQSFSANPTVSVPTNTLPFVPNPGLRNVPIGQPVMLQGFANVRPLTTPPVPQASYNWTITPPVGSAAILIDPTTRFPHFIPDVVGVYTVTETVSGIPLTIYAGTWSGILKPASDNNPLGVVDPTCTLAGVCHANSTAFNSPINDKFTEWKQSGHSKILVQAIGDPAGHYNLTSCVKCHSVGFAQYSSAIKANGFSEVSRAEGFTFKQGTASFVGFNNTLRVSEVQCENCHGPQTGGAHSVGAPANAIAANNDAVTARVSYSSDVCAPCHGEPLRHGRFQEWRESGHGNFELAIEEVLNSTGTLNTSCAGCHTGQGFIQFIKQLQAGNPLRTLSNNVGGNQSVANLAGLNKDNVQPITCVACHTPHNSGTQSGLVGAIVVLRGDYQTGGAFDGNTPLLPAGFQANGVGKGALCITCHNSRNGGSGTTALLHEDGTGTFPALTSYSSPHEACQGDVLMGRNAYFFGTGEVGQRSKHAMLADSCVTCHLQKTPADPNFGLTIGASGAGTNHSFGIITDVTKTAESQINALCAQCHGSFDGTGVQKSFDVAYKNLLIAIQNAIKRVKGDPAATNLVFIPGRTPQVSINGAVPVTLATYLASAPGTAGTGVIPASGFQIDIAKANWNTVLVAPRYDATFNGTSYNNGTPIVDAAGVPAEVAGDQSKAVHNPSFVFSVIDVTTKRMNAL